MEKKSISRSAFLSLRGLIALLLCGSACFIAVGTVPALLRPEAGAKASQRTLTFAERMSYQRAIEEVYWRHRIWPKARPDPKPSLDGVMSKARLEKKVADYLRKSQLVAVQRGSPITGNQLQVEMERIASHTKQPEVLHELFAALGNDPLVIAECLARPILAEQLAAQFNDSASESSRAKSRDPVERPLSNAAYTLPEISVPLDCADNTWAATSTVNVPDAREFYTAVWTGSEMIIWGGSNSNGGQVNSLNTGGRYSPSTDSWMATGIANAPLGRGGHTAVWTGSDVIIWGGANYPAGDLNTGGRYNPTDDSWTAISTPNLRARSSPTAVWTGSEMVVWGGEFNGGGFHDGGRYNPNTDSWTPTSQTNVPQGRWAHTAVWTGSEMIVWGGTNGMNYVNTGGKYNPNTDNWTATSTANAPLGRMAHTAVWTGSEMIVWGGVDENFNDTNTGSRYNPSTDSWMATNLGSGLPARDSHSAVWTGREMIIWGGESQTSDFNTGGRYDPGTDSWTPTTTANAPFPRLDHTAVWTGNQMIVWGGLSSNPPMFLNTGGRYCAQPSTPIVQSAVSRKTHGSAGSFDVNLPLSGTPGIECRKSGATGDYTIVVTFLANVSVNGNPQAAVTSGTGTIGSNGVSNGGMVTVAGNLVTIALTNVANAQTINVTLNSVNGSTNVTIPMRVLIGDVNGNGAVNSSDVASTKSRVGQQIGTTNFRSDVNADGNIDATDVSLVKSKVGTGLP